MLLKRKLIFAKMAAAAYTIRQSPAVQELSNGLRNYYRVSTAALSRLNHSGLMSNCSSLHSSAPL